MKSLKIGDVRLKNRLFLAPMVEVSDLPYRLICRKAGAGMAYTEMLYIDAILHENEKTKLLMKTARNDKPIGIQITGNNSEEFKKVVAYVKDYNLVDINCGCPSLRITGNQAGSYLLNHPDKIGRMIKILKDSGLTVSAKIRLGFKENNVLKVARVIERAGADALTIHGRLAIDGKSVKADWKWIEKVKNKIGIPVIGNGDVDDGLSASRMLDICDGVMIARGAIGDPYIFDRILYYLKTGKEKKFSFKKNVGAFLEYLKLCEKYGYKDIGRIKYVGSNFIRKIDGAGQLRDKFMRLKSIENIKGFFEGLK